MEIVALQPGDTDEFIRFAWKVYAGDHLWAPPLVKERKAFLDGRRNPFFEHGRVQLFTAWDGRRTVGRLAAVINDAHDRFHAEHAAFFGLFECLPDAEAGALALFRAAETWSREHGAAFLRGPVNLSTNELECGLLVEGFGVAPVFGSSYNPPHYAVLVEAAGFTKCKDLLAFYRYHYPPLPPRVLRALDAAARLRSRQLVTIRPIDRRQIDAEALRIASIYNEAWADNWGFVPITDAEARYLARKLDEAMLSEASRLAEVDGEAVACLVSMPDLNQLLRPLNGRLTPWNGLRARARRRHIDTARVALLGVKKPYRGLGLEARLLAEVWKHMPTQILHWELAWILEDNDAMIRLLQEVGAIAYKRYRLYQRTFA